MKFPNPVIVVPAVLLVRPRGDAGFEVAVVDAQVSGVTMRSLSLGVTMIRQR